MPATSFGVEKGFNFTNLTRPFVAVKLNALMYSHVSTHTLQKTHTDMRYIKTRHLHTTLDFWYGSDRIGCK